MASDSIKRCEWVQNASEKLVRYHDEEWGVPIHDDNLLYEALVLGGFQAGLSWTIVLKKREDFRNAFDCFDPKRVAKYDESKINELINDAGIIRNQQKINAAIKNAKAVLNIQKELKDFNTYIWSFVNGKTIINDWKQESDIPVSNPEAEAMSQDLKRRGFSFVGPTICYAVMQGVGMVNDHTVNCFRYHEINRMIKEKKHI